MFKERVKKILSIFKKDPNKKPLSWKYKLMILGGGLATFLILFLIRYIPGVSEGYTRTIGKVFAFLVGHLFTWMPFSNFEIIVFLIIISLILWLVFFIIKTAKTGIKNSFVRIIDLGIVIATMLSCYAMTFSFAYYRDPVEVPQYEEIFEGEDAAIYKEMAMYYEADFNRVTSELSFREDGSVISPYSYGELNERVKKSFDCLKGSDYYYDFTLNAKPLYMLSWFYTELQITGISFPGTYEPNYNINNPPCDIPFTVAHEIAHTKGVLREEDANLVAAYVCVQSEDPYIRYSGYMNTFFSLGNLVRATNVEEDYVNYVKGIHQNIWRDVSYTNKFWQEHDLLGDIGEFFNNLYLEMSANETTDAYVDHDDVEPEEQEGGEIIYKVYSYSPYQALLLHLYLNK